MSPKGPPFEFFYYFATECVFINQKGSPRLHFSALRDVFRKKFFFRKFQVFFQKNVLRFLSLRYSADLRRSRLVLDKLQAERFTNQNNLNLNEMIMLISDLTANQM